MRNVGTVIRGIRTPIIKEGDDLAGIVVDSVLKASKSENFELEDKDVIAVTEAVVGISERNYATLDEIVIDLQNKFKVRHIGVTFPILSRNRFALVLKSIARSMDKITLMLSYPSDEVGNSLFDGKLLENVKINPYSDVLDEETYRKYFGKETHIFTGVNYVDFYKELIESENCEVEFVFSNNVKTILDYTKNVLCCDIHTREESKRVLKENGGEIILSLTDILNESVNGSGYNEKYGLLGCNRSTEERVKLFPRTGDILVHKIQDKIMVELGVKVEVMVYGDGAFKDPVGHIWELADPVVSPAYTEGLEGTPNELKLKYLSDNKFADLRGEELQDAIRKEITEKDNNLKGKMATQGTTPRRYTDLIGSLCDLTSGSGDKGTPVVLVQRYFTNYSE